MTATEFSLETIQETYGQLPTAKEFFYDWGGANEALFMAINSVHSYNYDAFMLFITQLGNKEFFVPYMMVLGVYALLTLLFKKLLRKGGVKQQVVMWIGVFLVMVASFAFTALIIQWLKEYFAFPRPYMLVSEVVQVEPRNAEDARYSFPSGHVAFITLMIFSLWPMLSTHLKWLGLALIVMVSWSRVALGVHFPADTLWSVAVAFAIVVVMRTLIYTFLRKIFGLNCGGA